MIRGQHGRLAWALHRISGIGVAVFLLVHIADTALLLAGPAWYDRFVTFYRAPAIRVLEALLAGAVLFHGLNGLRLVVMDLWPLQTRAHGRLLWVVAALFVIVFAPAAFLILRPLFQGEG